MFATIIENVIKYLLMFENNEFENIKKVHMIGIGGSSMNGIAEILLHYGIAVSGSDRGESDNTLRLRDLGAVVSVGHRAENVPSDCDLVIYTLAVADDNPELLAAKEMGIPVIERGTFLGYIVSKHPKSLAVTGTHGKTTTTSMAASILISAGKDPCVHMGGFFPLIGGSVRPSSSEYLVTEACEYHRNMLNMQPFAGIILNVEEEHTDYYRGGLDEIKKAFSDFAYNIMPDGFLVVCIDDENASEVSSAARCKVITYSLLNDSAEFYAKNIFHSSEGKSTFTLCRKGEELGIVSITVPGNYNISNAVAASAAALELGCSFEDVKKGLADFVGANRRFQHVGNYNGARLIDDYAHHPTEIKEVMDTARSILLPGHKIYAVFQAHTYTRALRFRDAFCKVLSGADEIIVSDIYAAREKDPGTINGQMLCDHFRSAGLNATYFCEFIDIENYLKNKVKPDDLVISLGAGDIDKVVLDLAKG